MALKYLGKIHLYGFVQHPNGMTCWRNQEGLAHVQSGSNLAVHIWRLHGSEPNEHLDVSNDTHHKCGFVDPRSSCKGNHGIFSGNGDCLSQVGLE
jgi:hypothetical protein